MKVRIYSKKDCGICKAAKQKLEILGVKYEEYDLSYYLELHEGWREDGSVEIMAAHATLDTLPLIRVDESFHDYPTAMKILKNKSQQAQTA